MLGIASQTLINVYTVQVQYTLYSVQCTVSTEVETNYSNFYFVRILIFYKSVSVLT